MLRQRVLAVVVGLAVILGAVVLVNVVRRGGSSAYSPPTAEQKVGLVEFERLESSPKQPVASALDDRFDSGFPAPLVSPGAIQRGGPPPDGIPPIDFPLFQPAGDVDWVSPKEPVIVLTVDDEARAYPVQILTWHEIVNDAIGDVPVTVTYCPLCNTAVAYDRRIEGTIYDFGTSGSLYNSSLVMYDRQTESLWTHFDGRAVVGHLAGAQLSLLPVTTVSFEEYRAANPDGLVLSRVTGFDRSYGRNPYPGYDDAGDRPFLFDGVVDGRLAAKERVVVARSAPDDTGAAPTSVTVHRALLAERGVLEANVGGRRLVFVHRPGTTSALDASRLNESRDVGAAAVFELPDGAETPIPDGGGFRTSDGTTWDVFGRATGGPHLGDQLTPVEHLDTFWFAIAAFDPDTVLVLE